MADPGGFEPPTTGLGERQVKTRNIAKQSGNSQNTLDIRVPEVWELQLFLKECIKEREERTCRDYMNYLQKPLDLSKRWSVKAYRLYYKLVKHEDPPKQLKVKRGKPDTKVPSTQEIQLTLFKACEAGQWLCQVYKLLLESGARLSEIVKMLREYNKARDKDQGTHYEYQLGWHRGKKHSYIIFHVTRPNMEFGFTESWVTHKAMKYNLVRPKYVRKYVATRMLEMEIPRDAVNFIQGRVSEDVLAIHYLDRLVLARRYYPRYAEWVRSLYEELGL